MKCNFYLRDDVAQNADGWHYVSCIRCGQGTFTPFGPEKVHSDCPVLAPYGVGDAIAWLTVATGIAGWWHKKTAPKGGCDCDRRQAALNRVLPFPAVLRGLIALLAVWWRDRR